MKISMKFLLLVLFINSFSLMSMINNPNIRKNPAGEIEYKLIITTYDRYGNRITKEIWTKKTMDIIEEEIAQ